MRNLLLFTILIFGLCACGNDDEPESNNFAESNEIQYFTENAYLFFQPEYSVDLETGEVIESYDGSFSLILTDGTVFTTDDDDVLLSTTSNHAFVVGHDADSESVLSLEEVELNSGVYANEGDGGYFINLTPDGFEDIEMEAGVSYGEPSEDFGQEWETGSITISAVDLDYSTLTGTITMSYTMEDESGQAFTGSYTGEIQIIDLYE